MRFNVRSAMHEVESPEREAGSPRHSPNDKRRGIGIPRRVSWTKGSLVYSYESKLRINFL